MPTSLVRSVVKWYIPLPGRSMHGAAEVVFSCIYIYKCINESGLEFRALRNTRFIYEYSYKGVLLITFKCKWNSNKIITFGYVLYFVWILTGSYSQPLSIFWIIALMYYRRTKSVERCFLITNAVQTRIGLIFTLNRIVSQSWRYVYSIMLKN